jgi:hypothetical protein
MPEITMVRTVLTLVEGLAYEPWIKAVLLLGIAPLVVATCWYRAARRLMHPDSKALARGLLMGITRVNRRLEHASRYAPEVERRRRRSEPYVQLAAHGFFVVFFAFFALIALASFGLALVTKPTWFLVPLVFFFLFVTMGRFEVAATTWAWHSIRTGKAFTWPQRRAS